jgi:xylono-1,5-lactonase
MKFETLCFGYGLIEGPREDGAGNLHFSDVTNGGVYRRSPDGTITTVVPRRRGVGGIALHASGGLVISGKDVCHVREGETRVLLTRESVGAIGFNDLFTDAAGRIVVGSLRSDPFADGPRTPGALYRIELDGTVSELYGDIGLTNGIGLSPDGRTIFHADTSAAAVVAHDLAADGKATNRRVHARVDGMPDGLAVDVQGGVWVAVYGGGCAMRFAPDGSLDRRVEVPASAVTSLCFGGADRRDLYVVTADNKEDKERRGTVFHGRSEIAGVAVALARV